MLAQLIQQFTSEWVEYNRKTLINKIFRNDPQILGVVDVGCGGYQPYLPFLSKKFPNSIFLLGVDISKEKIHAMHAKVILGITDLICERIPRLKGRDSILVIEGKRTTKSINSSRFTSSFTTRFSVMAMKRKNEVK